MHMILRTRANLPGLKSAQGLDHQIRADRRQLRAQRLGGIFLTNRNVTLHEYVTSIEPRVDAHGRNAGDGFAVGDRPLNGRCAAILWQQRRMQIQISEPGKINHPLRNDAAIADDNDRIRSNCHKLVAEFGIVFDGNGLYHGNAQAGGRILHRRNRHFHAAPARPIRLRHHHRHGMTGLDQSLQGRDSEARSATENQEHRSGLRCQVSGLRKTYRATGSRATVKGSRNKCFS